MSDDKLVEVMAKLGRMHTYDLAGNDPLAASALRQWVGEVRDALAVVQREGWVLVPREPDEAMVDAGTTQWMADNSHLAIWDAMVDAAAPQPEDSPDA